MDRSAVTQRVWDLAEPLVLGRGLEVVDVQFRPEGGRTMLRLFIDRPDGRVTLDELARVSRELGDVLDAHDAVPGRYHLECSSPGLERPLVREEHFRRVIGQRIHLRSQEPIAGRRQFHGTLEAVTPEGVTIQDPDAGAVLVPFAVMEKASLAYEFTKPTRPTRPSQARA
jgi:ribosome maturation factor RimP